MFSNGRYVIVDDDLSQLRPLVEALHSLGAPTLGIHYRAEHGLADGQFRGVRILFMDLHLQGLPVGGKEANYGLIAGLLEKCVVPESGPYVLVLWTSHVEELQQFTEYIEKGVSPAHRPLAILGLNKNKYLVPGKEDPAQLRLDIENAIGKDVRLKAMLSWEHDVLSAAGATLSEIGALIPEGDRTIDRYPDALDGILSLLAVAAVGKTNASRDARAAVSAALAPLLADRIVNQAGSAPPDLWTQAVTRSENLPLLDTARASRMNTLVHLALPASGVISPTDWGAVIEMPEAELTDEALSKRFGHNRTSLIEDLFLVDATSPGCRLYLLRLGAVCDYAQGRSGPVTYCLALLKPAAVARLKGRKVSEAEYATVTFSIPAIEGLFSFLINARLQVTLTSGEVDGWDVLCRIREQLLTTIAVHNASYASRPGFLSFYGKG